MSRIDSTGDLHVTGTVYANAIMPATGTLDADRLQQLPPVTVNFGIDSDAVPTNTTRIIFVAASSGNVRIARAALVAAGTVTDVDFDLLKNGVSVLSAAINVVHGTGDGNFVTGTISTAPFVQDDIFTADLAVTSSTGALGPVLLVHFEEDPV